MGGNEVLIIFALLAIIGGFWWSQKKFENKMLCVFVRANRTDDEKFVPLHVSEVIYKPSRNSQPERYVVNSKCIVLHKYNKGINKFFPTYVPKLTFVHWSETPIDFRTMLPTQYTPAARDAALQEHNQIAFAKAAAGQSGLKKRFPDWFFPMLALGVSVVVLFLVWQMQGQIGMLEQLIRVK